MGRPLASSIVVATADRILDAAVDEFAVRGFDGARLADIAAVAGITRPSLLHHFTTKEGLYAAALERAFRALAEVLLAAVGSQGSFRDRLHFLVDGFIEFARSHPSVCRLFLRAAVADDDETTRSLLAEHAAPLLDDVTAFLSKDGAEELRAGLPLRAGLMSVIVNVLCKTAAGPLRPVLWGDDDDDEHIWLLVEHALLVPATREEAP